MNEINLQNVLDGFNAPLNEEQAWAICFQCASYFQTEWNLVDNSHSKACHAFNGLDALFIGNDGTITRIVPPRGSQPAKSQLELVQCIGVLIYQALDFGLGETEEHALSADLEKLIDAMTEGQREEDGEQDEGIEDEDDLSPPNANSISLADVMQMCMEHLPTQSNPSSHYKAVCRALVTESIELTTFLESISNNKSKLKSVDVDEMDENEDLQLQQLQRADWARLWMQVMRELRMGRKNLKKVDDMPMPHASSYELTPYEALMKDIKAKKYQLKQVTINSDIPLRTKKDAHDIILDFIRSRPPLHPVRERKCQRSALEKKPLPLREQLMESIRSEPKLKPTASQARLVETSRTRLNESDAGSLPPARKVIKPNMSFQLNSFSDSDDDSSDGVSTDDDVLEDRNKIEAQPFSPITPLSPKSSPATALMSPPSQWQQTETVVKATRVPIPPIPAHIRKKLMKNATTVDRLSLTMEEVMHIRNVLTKAELESLLVKPDLHQQVEKGKVCFTCLKTKFSLFGAWSTKCKMCNRFVCSKCVSKMNIPTERFESIPVYTLCPSPFKSSQSKDDLFIVDRTGSEPNSPELDRKSPANSSSSRGSDGVDSKTRRKVARSATLRQSASGKATASANIKGTEMSVCRDCKAMVVSIIKSSRGAVGANALAATLGMNSGSSSAASSPGVSARSDEFKGQSLESARAALRHFRLDLKPVYKMS